MHWIIQTDIFKEDGWTALVETLERFDIPYSIHKVIPFVGDIIPDANPEGRVICMGTFSLRHLAKTKQWYPGVFDLEPFDFNIQREHWGQHMLNFEAVVNRFEDANITGPTFIRPILDSKSFSGKVFQVDEFYDWKRKVCVLDEQTGSTVSKDTLIQLCPTQEIYAEFRYWIVKGKIITKSMYKRGDKIRYSSDVDAIYDQYVLDRIAEWQPLEAFVIDVCDTPNGFKVVEINTLNSSGFYAGDMQKLVLALEDGFGVSSS